MKRTQTLTARVLPVVAAFVASGVAIGSSPAPATPHPGLLFDATELRAIRARASHPVLAPVASRLVARADALLTAPPLLVSTTARGEPDPPGHLKGLEAARRLQGRVLTHAMAYLLGGDRRYVDAAVRELDHAIEEWPIWVDTAHAPPYDLMTGELCLTYGLAYDWLYDAMSIEERKRLREGLERRGLGPYLDATSRAKPMSWYTAHHNWNAVCNGGAAVAALAFGTESAMSDRVVDLAVAGMAAYWNHLPSDGGWDEGTGYWTYGHRYAFMAADALRRSGRREAAEYLGREGARRTGYFPLVFNPGRKLSASFGDSPGRAADALLYFLAREYRNPDFAWFQDRAPARSLASEGWPEEALALIWRSADEPWLPESVRNFSPHVPAVASFPSIGWALLAPSQPDPPFFLAFKNGSLAANHSHLDLNHVSVGVGDTMLLVDLGNRPYPADYFSRARYGYYEISTAGHNTLLIDGTGQRTGAVGTLRGPMEGRNYTAFIGVADGAYEAATTRVRRHVVFVDRRYFVLLDEVETPAPALVEMRFHTYASVAGRPGGGWTVSENGVAADVIPADSSSVDESIETPAGWIRQVKTLSVKTRERASRRLLATVILPRVAGLDVGGPVTQQRRAGQLVVSVAGDRLVFREAEDGFQLAAVTSRRRIRQ